MGRVERLVSIVMILLQKDVVSSTQLSQMLDVTKRTILRDMQTLSLSKIPIYSVNGVNGGYGIMNEYKIDKHLLSNSDIENILTALTGLEQILYSKEVEATINKIQAMVSATSVNQTIQVTFYDWSGRPEIIDICRTCQEAISKNRLISFDYTDRNGVMTNRIVEPYRLHFSEMSWYLKAFSIERNEYRTFKLSRTENLVIKTDSFMPRDHLIDEKSGSSYPTQLTQVKALISPGIKDHFIERYGKNSIETYDADFFLASINLPQNSYGYQFLASFGSNVKIIEPQSYVESYREFLYKLVELYQ